MRLFWTLFAFGAALFVACCLTARRDPATPIQLAHQPPLPQEPAAPSAEIADAPQPVTLQECVELLKLGRAWLATVPDYTAVFRKQERVGDELREVDATDLKLRHQPFSVALAWREGGRIAFYRDGHNQNRMLVRMGGWKQRLGWIALDPDSTLALNEARYPITDVGLARLTEQLLERFAPYLDRVDGVRCAWLNDEEVGGRRCRVFLVEYASEDLNPLYRKSLVWLDRESSTPLAVQNFDWRTDDPANPEGLVEYYAYENVRFGCGLRDHDFEIPRPSDSASEVVVSEAALD